MKSVIIITIAFVLLIPISAYAAQLDARINPDADSSPFKMSYLKTVFIEYPNEGNLFDELRGKQWTITGMGKSNNG